MQETKQISRSAGAFFSGTVLSRASGFGRDLAMAICFGATPMVAAFMVAFRFANLARRLFGESPLSASFIPHFEALNEKSSDKAQQFFADFFSTLLCVLIGFVCLAMISLPSNHIGHLTRLMLPGLIFICLSGLSSAYLHTKQRFLLSSVSPVAFNLIWIVGVVALREHPDPMPWLALCIVAGFALQWMVSAFPLIGQLKFFKKARLFSPEVRAVVMPFFFGILGVGAGQINSALDALFARFALPEGPAYLWYAIRLQQLPLACFGMAWSAALLPTLVKMGADKKTVLKDTITKCAYFLIPITFAFLPCAGAGVNLLYHHGNFSAEAVTQTTYCLWGYGLGLFPSALVMMCATFCYAEKDYKTPSRGAIYAVLINISLNAMLIWGAGLGPASVAIATSCSQIFNALYLLRKKCIVLPKKLFLVGIWSLVAASIAYALYPEKACSTDLGEQALELLLPLAVCVSVYALGIRKQAGH